MHNNLTAVPAARHSLGAWTALCPLRGLHDLIRIAGCQECWRESALARLSSGGDDVDVMKVFPPRLIPLFISIWRHESRRQRLHVRYV